MHEGMRVTHAEYESTQEHLARALCGVVPISELAELLGVTTRAVRYWIEEGELVAYKQRYRGTKERAVVPLWAVLEWQLRQAAREKVVPRPCGWRNP